MSDASKITVAGEWTLFASQAGPELLSEGDAAYMWTAGFACALHLMKKVSRLSSTRAAFRDDMERLLAEAEQALAGGAQQ
jgi:hypothetical protein